MNTKKENDLKTAWLLFLLMLSFWVAGAQQSWFVSKGGSDANNGKSPANPFRTIDKAVNKLNPGDTLFIMGEFTNDSFNPNYTYSGNINDPYIWHQENTIRINGLHGQSGAYITIKAYDENTVIKGDGANLFRMTNCSYIIIENLELYGQVEHIPLQTALDLQFLYREAGSNNTLYRVPPGTSDEEVADMTFPALNNVSRPSYTDTRGFYLSNVHHIKLLRNEVHHTGGNGFRVADGEYIDIIENEVHNTSRKSYSGTHGMVVTKTKSTDNFNGYKVKILRNKVHHNYNEIYSWAPSKTFITPRIDEGKGISLQRNNTEGWVDGNGRILVQNNICYWNGFSGIHSNDGYRIDFINNTAYMNSYTNTVTYAGKEQKGNNIGISTQRGNDIKIINNISVIDTDWNGYALAASNSSGPLEVRNNVIFGTGNNNVRISGEIDAVDVATLKANPLFTNPGTFDFSLTENSPAIAYADAAYAPDTDFNGAERDSDPDAGALEYGATLAVENITLVSGSIYPNPFTDKFFLKLEQTNMNIGLYDVLGRDFSNLITANTINSGIEIDATRLPQGRYILRVGNQGKMIVKINR